MDGNERALGGLVHGSVVAGDVLGEGYALVGEGGEGFAHVSEGGEDLGDGGEDKF